jgi:hypothetical protein
MVQFSTQRNLYLNNNDEIYEVVMVAGQAGPSAYVPAGNLNTATDAFGRLRISSPYTLFDSHNLLNENDKFDEQLTGAGNSNYNANTSSVNMTVTSASGDQVIRQTKRRFSYQPGKSLLLMSTFVMSKAKENLRQRVGYFDDENGIYLERDGTDLNLVLRSYASGSVVETRVPRTEWNGDPLNGSGTSKISLTMQKAQIFWTDIEWLGVGSVRAGFVINGQFILAHTFHNANINESVYMTTPNLPLRYELTNTGITATSSTLKQICNTALSEGGYEARATENIIGTTALTGQTVGTAYTNLATIRLRQSGAVVVPSGADILNISNTDFEWALFKNVTPNTAFTWSNATDNVQYSLEAKTFTDTGTRVSGGYMGGKTAPVALGDGGFDWDYQIGELIDGTSETLTLAVRASSSSKAAAGIMKWYEL